MFKPQTRYPLGGKYESPDGIEIKSKNLEEDGSFTVIYEIPSIPTTWEQPCPVCGINKQFVICVRDYYGYDTSAETGSGVLETNYAPFESEDIQQYYEAFMALGT